MKNNFLSPTVEIAADTLCLIFSFLAAYYIRNYYGIAIQPLSFYLPLVAVSVLSCLCSASLFSLYGKKRVIFSLSYIADFLRTYALWVFCVVAYSFFFKMGYSRAVVLLYLTFSFFLLYAFRFIAAWSIRSSYRETEIITAAKGILAMAQVTPDPLSLLENIRIDKSSDLAYHLTKRFVDVTTSFLAIIAALPLLPFIVWNIRRDSAGPALIFQERIGKNGETFLLYKFRTMYADTPLYAESPRHHDDPRVTPFGKFLRKYSLDELPQLWNILRGDMSVVGPRPEMPFIVGKYAPWQKARLRTTPGLTGLWQILGRKDLPLEENLEYDLYYVFNQSLFFDLAIILKTFPHLLIPKGAY